MRVGPPVPHGPVAGDSRTLPRLPLLPLLLGLALVGLVLGGCRPLYLPPVPEAPPYDPGARVVSSVSELDAAGRPRLELTLADLDAGGWLAVQWMAPSGRQAASASIWVEPEEPAAVFVLPADVELSAGEWRAVVSLGSLLLRQFTFTVE